MDYEIIIGLEVHLQSKTKSKMFCGCSTDYFGKDPNTYTCPVCLGLPGAMPVPNKHAIDLCIKMALGLNCKIPLETKFDRKNYFYPDLPKGYQISQYDQPIGVGGFVEIDVDGKKRKIGITRVHQEEDTGKSIHNGDSTLLDFNKSGVPLIEVVSEPDLRSVEEVTEYAKLLHRTVRRFGISDGDMEKGQMRFEINISLRKKGEKDLPVYKVEVKNIGSISVLQKVIEKEVERQLEILESGKTPVQETRGLTDMSGNTFTQRVKETSDDYRYFPEPDIPLIKFTKEYIENIRLELPESPQVRVEEYTNKFGLENKLSKEIVSNSPLDKYLYSIYKRKEFSGYVKELIKKGFGENSKKVLARETANIVIQRFPDLKKRDLLDTLDNIVLIEIAYNNSLGIINRGATQYIIDQAVETGDTGTLIIEKDGLHIMSDENIILDLVKDVIRSNPKVVNDYKKNPNAIMALVGQVMKQSKGKADAKLVKSTLEDLLKK